MTPSSILIAYVFVGCVYWLWMFAGTLRSHSQRAVACAVQRTSSASLAQALDHHPRLQ